MYVTISPAHCFTKIERDGSKRKKMAKILYEIL